jgi:hypothetical protein
VGTEENPYEAHTHCDSRCIADSRTNRVGAANDNAWPNPRTDAADDADHAGDPRYASDARYAGNTCHAANARFRRGNARNAGDTGIAVGHQHQRFAERLPHSQVGWRVVRLPLRSNARWHVNGGRQRSEYLRAELI